MSMLEKLRDEAMAEGSSGGGGVTIRNQDKTITENGSYTADSGYTGLGTVTVAVPQEEPVVEPLEVTENGTYNPPDGVDGYGPVVVNVEASGGGDDLVKAIVGRTITEYSDSEITVIGDSAFRNCKTLQRVNLPEVKTIGGNGFDGCSNLADIYFPKLEGVTGLANIAVEEAHFPKAKTVGYGSFGGNAKLKRIVLDECTAFYGHCLKGDSSLNVIVVRPESVASNAGTHTLQSTPFADGGTGGVLLIPSSVVEGYKTATNWSVFYAYGHNRFLALEDYTVDGTVTGEIDWDKVNALFEEASA